MDKKVLKALSLVTQLALSMAVPIFLCTFAGIGLDRLFGTSPFFFAGAYSAWHRRRFQECLYTYKKFL